MFGDNFIYGDFTFPAIDWNKVSSDNDLERDVTDYINSMELQQKN